MKGALGEFAQAVLDYTEVISLAPQFVYAYNNPGSSLGSLGETARATDDFLTANRINPGNPAYRIKVRELVVLVQAP